MVTEDSAEAGHLGSCAHSLETKPSTTGMTLIDEAEDAECSGRSNHPTPQPGFVRTFKFATAGTQMATRDNVTSEDDVTARDAPKWVRIRESTVTILTGEEEAAGCHGN